NEQEPVDHFKGVQRPERICPASANLGWIEKLNQGKRIEGSDFKPGRVGFHKQKPADFENFRNKKDELGADDHPPALTVSDPVSEHKTAYPDHKGDDRELPEVHKGNGKQLEPVERL